MAEAKAPTPPAISMAFSSGVITVALGYHERDFAPNTNVMQAACVITPVKPEPERQLADFAARLKWAREQLGADVTQTALAKKAGLKSQGSVGNWEGGARKAPRDVVKLAAALGVNAKWLLHGAGPCWAANGASVNDLRTPEGRLVELYRVIESRMPNLSDLGRLMELMEGLAMQVAPAALASAMTEALKAALTESGRVTMVLDAAAKTHAEKKSTEGPQRGRGTAPKEDPGPKRKK